MRRERSVFALTSAIGCAIVIFLSIGVAGMFSLFIPEYMAEYGYSKMEMSYVAMVATVSGFLFSLIGSKLINALGPKKSLLVGSLASAVFLCLIGSVDNLVALGLVSLAQGAVLGLGAHASCAGVIAGWYGDRMASVIGVVFGFSSFGSTVFSLLAGQLLKVMSYHTILVSFGIGAAVIGVLANLLLIRMPAAQRPAAESGAAAAPTEEDGVGYHRAIRSPAFVLFFIAMMGGGYSLRRLYDFRHGVLAVLRHERHPVRHQYQLPFIFRRADLHGLRGDPGEIRLQGSHDADFRRIYRRHGAGVHVPRQSSSLVRGGRRPVRGFCPAGEQCSLPGAARAIRPQRLQPDQLPGDGWLLPGCNHFQLPSGVDFRDLRKLHELLHVSGGDCADLFRTVFCSDTPLPLPAGTARREKVLTVPPTGIGGQISEP